MANIRYSKYTDKEIDELLTSLVVLVDSREQKAGHVIKYLDDKKIKHEVQKLEHGDYSCYIPKNEELGIYRDMYLTNIISIERKANLEELSNNFTKGRSQIENEFIRSKGKLMLLIENACYEDIVLHKYKTKYKPISFIATLKTFESRYGIETNFIRGAFSGNFIYMTLKYSARELLKHGRLGQAI